MDRKSGGVFGAVDQGVGFQVGQGFEPVGCIGVPGIHIQQGFGDGIGCEPPAAAVAVAILTYVVAIMPP